MMRESFRPHIVARQIQKEVSVILQRGIKDGELGLVTITSVDLTRDLSYAEIFVTFLNDSNKDVLQRMQVLSKATPYVRALLGRKMRLRAVPDLKFNYDRSLCEGIRLSKLATEAVQNDQVKRRKSQSNEGST